MSLRKLTIHITKKFPKGCALYLGMSENTKFQVQKLGCALYLGASYTWVITVRDAHNTLTLQRFKSLWNDTMRWN